MREILTGLGTIGAALVIVAAVVFAGRDSALFVPPPEVIAEEFARELGSRRYDLARRHLSSSAREIQTVNVLDMRFEPMRSRMGAVNRTKAVELSRDAERASAVCELTGERATVTFTFALKREQGLWAIDSWEAAETFR